MYLYFYRLKTNTKVKFTNLTLTVHNEDKSRLQTYGNYK